MDLSGDKDEGVDGIFYEDSDNPRHNLEPFRHSIHNSLPPVGPGGMVTLLAHRIRVLDTKILICPG
jgi:hypothetical protein